MLFICREQRFVVNKFFTSLPQYATITTYLKKLMNLDNPTTKKTRTEVAQDS